MNKDETQELVLVIAGNYVQAKRFIVRKGITAAEIINRPSDLCGVNRKVILVGEYYTRKDWFEIRDLLKADRYSVFYDLL